MAVASFDQNVAFMQNVLATQGESTANALKREREQAGSMQSERKREIDDDALKRMSERDKRRSKTDPTFKPEDSDFSAPRTYQFFTNVDYYQALGIEEYATNEEIKKAYRKLSLTYHPDKTNALDQEQKDEYAAIFIELKNAYRLLSDNPSRRQYDYHRDRNSAREKISGKKQQDVPSFNAREALRRLEARAAEKARKPSEDQKVPVPCKLEKIVYGGHKKVRHNRRVRDRGSATFMTSARDFRLDIPAGALPPHPVTFQRAGDHHEDRQPDNLQFLVTPRIHDVVDVEGLDLKVRNPVDLGMGWNDRPHVLAEAPSVRGRHNFLFGRNPFHGGGAAADRRQLRVTLPGQGISEEGSLSFCMQLDMRGARSSSSSALRRPWAAASNAEPPAGPSPLNFLERFELGPPWGLHGQPQTDHILRASEHPVMKRRLARGEAANDACNIRLARVGQPIAMYTKPPCTLSFYSNAGQTSCNGLPAPPMCALCLSCPTCGKKKAYMHWDRLKRDLFPWLLGTGFLLLRQAFGVLPKCLIGRAAWKFATLPESSWPETLAEDAESDVEPLSDGSDLDVTVYIDRECDISTPFKLARRTPVKDLKKMILSSVLGGEGSEEIISLKVGERVLTDNDCITSKMTEIDLCDADSSPTPPPKPKRRRRKAPKAKVKTSSPIKHLADAAFKDGAYWYALALYSHVLRELPENTEDVPKVLSNRAACLAKLGDFSASLNDARGAAELAPGWGRAWSRIGLAAWKLGRESLPEAQSAYMRAVELEPTGANVDALQGIVHLLEANNIDNAHDSQEKGNQAFRVKEFGLAVAEYTRGIASLPPLVQKPADDSAEQIEDVHALLRAVLFMNRSIAFMRLCYWPSAVADARKAVEAKPDFAKARGQYAVALLGNREHEQAYLAFAQALHMDQSSRVAEQGRKTCLLELQFWRSRASRHRLRNRWSLDWTRPKGSTRVFAISDIHFANRGVQDWAHAIDDFAFLDDTLIIAGNLAESLGALVRGLTTFKSKFRRVFYTVGNREMWLVDGESSRYPDSLAKLHAIFETCDRLQVDFLPAPVCDGLFIVPLLSWYTAEFDEKDPFPTMNADINKKCKWPVDADEQLWKYMLKLNEEHLANTFRGTVITFSHFLPRRGLPFDKDIKYMAKCVGCEAIDKQVRAVNSKLHVFGHSGQKYASAHQGVKYVHMPLGKLESFAAGTEKDQQDAPLELPPLMLIHNGRHLCMQEWAIDGNFANRVQLLCALEMPKLIDESDEHKELRKVIRKINDVPGVRAHFHSVGTRKMSKEQLTKFAWPELEKLTQKTTHGLHVVVDDLKTLQEFVRGDAYKEWRQKTQPRIESSVGLFAPLGLRLQPHDPVTLKAKEDAMIAVYFLTLQDTVTEDSQKYGEVQSAVVAINRLPGVAGKIEAAIQPVGFPPLSAAQLLSKVHLLDITALGCTHLFLVAVDSPESLKLLYQSKTFAKWKSSIEPLLKRGAPLPQLAFAIPMGVTATPQAPPSANARQPE